MQVWNVLHVARWKYRTQKSFVKIAQPSHNFVGLYLRKKRHVSTIGKKTLLSSNISSRCPHNIVNFDLLAAEIGPVVWGTPANFSGLCFLAALLHGTPVVSVSQSLRCWTEGASRVWQGSHQVGHWPTFLVDYIWWMHRVPVVLHCWIISLVACKRWHS